MQDKKTCFRNLQPLVKNHNIVKEIHFNTANHTAN